MARQVVLSARINMKTSIGNDEIDFRVMYMMTQVHTGAVSPEEALEQHASLVFS